MHGNTAMTTEIVMINSLPPDGGLNGGMKNSRANGEPSDTGATGGVI